MKKIRELIRLKSTTRLSDRQIARALNISRPVVAKYRLGFCEIDLSFVSPAEIPDRTLLVAIKRPHMEASGEISTDGRLVEMAKANNLDLFHFMCRLFQELPEADTAEKLLQWNMKGIPLYKLETCEN